VQLDGLLATRLWGFCFDSNLTMSDDWDPATTGSKGCKPGWPCSLVDAVAYVGVRSGVQNKASRREKSSSPLPSEVVNADRAKL
jgi:hypothetical protein